MALSSSAYARAVTVRPIAGLIQGGWWALVLVVGVTGLASLPLWEGWRYSLQALVAAIVVYAGVRSNRYQGAITQLSIYPNGRIEADVVDAPRHTRAAATAVGDLRRHADGLAETIVRTAGSLVFVRLDRVLGGGWTVYRCIDPSLAERKRLRLFVENSAFQPTIYLMRRRDTAGPNDRL